MAIENKEVQVRIVAGPSTLELIASLTRKGHGPYGIDMDKATSVHFTTDGKTSIAAFSGAIEGMKRIVRTGDRWILNGSIFDYNEIHFFKGDYNAKTRNGHFTLD